jgi:signal transduction histidine kinase
LPDIQPAGMLAQAVLAVITRIFSDDCAAGLPELQKEMRESVDTSWPHVMLVAVAPSIVVESDISVQHIYQRRLEDPRQQRD